MSARRLTSLVFLAAASMVLQYAAQGALAAGFNPREFGAWFWYADSVLWGLRALIDAAVIVSLFQTQARNVRDARLLTGFEVAMIALIAATMGPALVAIARGVAIDGVLSPGLRWAWSFLIAAYAPLMIGAAGLAYKVQTAGTPLPVIPARVADENPGASYEELLQAPAVDDLRELQAVPAPAPFPATVQRGKRAQIRALHAQHPDWSNAQLAQVAGCHISTVGRALP